MLLLLLCGCSGLTDITESLSKKETQEIKMQTTDKGNNSYSGDPQDNIHVTASGNATIELVIGEKGKVEKNEKRDAATEEEIEASFSVDYYLRAIPTTGWVLILVCLIILSVILFIFLKTTMAGKAFDAGIAKAIDITGRSIDVVRDKLSDATKGSELHSELLGELSRLQAELGDLKEQKRVRKGSH